LEGSRPKHSYQDLLNDPHLDFSSNYDIKAEVDSHMYATVQASWFSNVANWQCVKLCFFWWRQLAAGWNLKFASWWGGQGERSCPRSTMVICSVTHQSSTQPSNWEACGHSTTEPIATRVWSFLYSRCDPGYIGWNYSIC